MGSKPDIKETKAPSRPSLRIVESVVSVLDAGSRTRMMSLPQDVPGMKCHIVDGEIQGRRHRVIVEETGAGTQGVLGRIRSLAEASRTLKADAAFLCGTKGISAERLLFALNQGVHVLESDPRGRARVHTGRASIVRHVSIEDWALSLAAQTPGSKGFSFDSRSDISGLLYRGKPLANWLCKSSRKLLRTVNEDCLLKAEYTMKRPVRLGFAGRTLETTVLEVWYVCRVRFRLHSSCVEIGNFAYDPPRAVASGPGFKRAGQGPSGGKGMEPVFAVERNSADLVEKAPLFQSAHSELKPDHHVYHPFRGIDGKGAPALDQCVESVRVTVDSGLPAFFLP